MSALEMLIKVKQQSKTDDVIVLLNEIAAYEKLSKAKAFRDLASDAVKDKLPLLHGAYTGNLYNMALLDLVGNIMVYLEGTRPHILEEPLEFMTDRQKRQLEIMQDSVIKVGYHSMIEYKHRLMQEKIVGIFESERDGKTTILIIIREGNQYEVYQGNYNRDVSKTEKTAKLQPYVKTEGGWSLSISSYSIQGNNGYPFGKLKCPKGDYDVMLPNHDRLWLIPATGNTVEVILDMGKINQLNFAKCDIRNFMDCIWDFCKEGLDYEEIG